MLWQQRMDNHSFHLVHTLCCHCAHVSASAAPALFNVCNALLLLTRMCSLLGGGHIKWYRAAFHAALMRLSPALQNRLGALLLMRPNIDTYGCNTHDPHDHVNSRFMLIMLLHGVHPGHTFLCFLRVMLFQPGSVTKL